MKAVVTFHVGSGVFQVLNWLPGRSFPFQQFDEVLSVAVVGAGILYFLDLPFHFSFRFDCRGPRIRCPGCRLSLAGSSKVT